MQEILIYVLVLASSSYLIFMLLKKRKSKNKDHCSGCG